MAEVQSLYLDLMRRNLTRYGMSERTPKHWPLRKRLLLKMFNIWVPMHFYSTPFGQRKRELGLDWPPEAETMIGMQRLTSLQHCVETVLDEDVPGDLIECGVWRGGACILMRAVLAAYGDEKRRVWLADSFAGLPPPDTETYAADTGKAERINFRRRLPSPSAVVPGLNRALVGMLAVPETEVRANIQRYGLLDDQVGFLPGWFKDTLPDAPIDSIAVLRIDGDLYESTMQALEALYPRLSPGGFCVIDDYLVSYAPRQAVTDYRAEHGITGEIVDIDGTGVLWRK
jgi:O-methyltransferase